MEDDKGVELLVVGGNVLSNPGPVVHGHVAGVQQWLILVNTVEDAVFVECQPACRVCVCWGEGCVSLSMLVISARERYRGVVAGTWAAMVRPSAPDGSSVLLRGGWRVRVE